MKGPLVLVPDPPCITQHTLVSQSLLCFYFDAAGHVHCSGAPQEASGDGGGNDWFSVCPMARPTPDAKLAVLKVEMLVTQNNFAQPIVLETEADEGVGGLPSMRILIPGAAAQGTVQPQARLIWEPPAAYLGFSVAPFYGREEAIMHRRSSCVSSGGPRNTSLAFCFHDPLAQFLLTHGEQLATQLNVPYDMVQVDAKRQDGKTPVAPCFLISSLLVNRAVQFFTDNLFPLLIYAKRPCLRVRIAQAPPPGKVGFATVLLQVTYTACRPTLLTNVPVHTLPK